jgi:hypothetical protein
LASLVENRLGIETRYVILGHLQRGGPPTAYDRVLATRFGIKAAELVLNGQFGQMAALRGSEIVAVPLAQAVAEIKKLDLRYYEEAQEWFFGGLYATTHFAAVKRGRYRREPGLDKPRPSALCSMLTAPSRFPHYAFSYAGQARPNALCPSRRLAERMCMLSAARLPGKKGTIR